MCVGSRKELSQAAPLRVYRSKRRRKIFPVHAQVGRGGGLQDEPAGLISSMVYLYILLSLVLSLLSLP